MSPFRRVRARAITLTSITVALLVAVFTISACSSGDEVEASDTSESAVTTETTASGPEAADDEGQIETETEAMGEDDTDRTAGTTIVEGGTTDGSSAADDNGADDQDSEPSQIDDAELAAALEAGQSELLGLPFMYVTAEQDCDGCAERVSLYYVPGPVRASVLVLDRAFVDGGEVDLGEVDPTLIEDPRLVAEQLVAAAASTDVAYSIDPVSGLITRWTVGGDTVTLRCLQVDTRPIDLRSEVCRDSLIG